MNDHQEQYARVRKKLIGAALDLLHNERSRLDAHDISGLFITVAAALLVEIAGPHVAAVYLREFADRIDVPPGRTN